MKPRMIVVSLMFFLVMPCIAFAGDWLEKTSRDAKRNLESQKKHGGFYPDSSAPKTGGQGPGQPSGQDSGVRHKCPPGWFFADAPFGQGKCMPPSK
jgi:hypothetical protein